MLDFPSVFVRIRSCTMYFFSVLLGYAFSSLLDKGNSFFSSAVLIGDFELRASPLSHSGYMGGKRKSTTSLLKSHVPSQSALSSHHSESAYNFFLFCYN